MLAPVSEGARPDIAGKQAWVEVFAGASSEARQVVERLAAQGIPARLEPAGESRAKVSVRPFHAKVAREVIRAPQGSHAGPQAPGDGAAPNVHE